MQTRRRTQGLLIEALPEETVVYDTTRHQVHCLNRAATLVWQHCDGQTSPAELAELLRQELDLPADEEMVGLIQEQLAELHLLEERSAKPVGAARRTRREVAKQLALVGLTGVVMTIAAPTAHAAGSCTSTCNNGHVGQPCCNPPGGTCTQTGTNTFSCI